MAYVASHDRHTVDKRRSGDESVTIRSRIGHMKGRASLSNRGVNRQNATGKRGQNVSVHPTPKNFALLLVSTLDEKDSYFQLQY